MGQQLVKKQITHTPPYVTVVLIIISAGHQ